MNISKMDQNDDIINAVMPFASIALCVYFSLVITASLIFNSALITIIAKQKELHTMSHLFIVNLALSNLLTSTIFVPFDIDTLIRGEFVHGKVLCGVYKLTYIFSMPSAMINLLFLTLDTFLTIVFPYKKKRFVTKRKVAIALVIGYTYALLFTLYPILRNPTSAVIIWKGGCVIDCSMTYLKVFFSLNMFPTLLLVVIFDAWIFGIANGQSSKMASFFRVASPDPKFSTLCLPLPMIEDTVINEKLSASIKDVESETKKISSLRKEVEIVKKNSGFCLSSSPVKNRSSSLFIKDMPSMPSMPSIHEQPVGNNLDETENSIVLANGKIPHSSTQSLPLSEKTVNSCHSLPLSERTVNSRHSLPLSERTVNSRHSIPLSEQVMKESMITITSVASSIPRSSLHWKKESQDSVTCIVRGKAAFILNLKAAKRISLLVGECLFCWLIYDIIVLRNFYGYYSKELTQIGRCIMYSSLFLNPLVYGLYNPAIKKIVFKTCRYVTNRNDSSENSESQQSSHRLPSG